MITNATIGNDQCLPWLESLQSIPSDQLYFIITHVPPFLRTRTHFLVKFILSNITKLSQYCATLPFTCLFVVNVSRSSCFSTMLLLVYFASHFTSERAKITSLQSGLDTGWNTEFACRTSYDMNTDTIGRYWNGMSFLAGNVCIICFWTLIFCLPVALLTFVCSFFSRRMNLAIGQSTCCSAHFDGLTISLCLSRLSSKKCLMHPAASVIPCRMSI